MQKLYLWLLTISLNSYSKWNTQFWIPNIERFFLSDAIPCLLQLRESHFSLKRLHSFQFLISIHKNFKMNDQSVWCLFNKLRFSLVIPSSLVWSCFNNKKGKHIYPIFCNLFHVMVRFSINFFFSSSFRLDDRNGRKNEQRLSINSRQNR